VGGGNCGWMEGCGMAGVPMVSAASSCYFFMLQLMMFRTEPRAQEFRSDQIKRNVAIAMCLDVNTETIKTQQNLQVRSSQQTEQGKAKREETTHTRRQRHAKE